MKGILTKFLARFNRKNAGLLTELIKDASLRETLLGVQRMRPLTDEKTLRDASRVINFSRSEDYSVFAEELWGTAVFYVKCLTDINLKPEEVGFYRGCLSATLDDLRISYKAFQYMESLKNKPPRGQTLGEIRPPLGA